MKITKEKGRKPRNTKVNISYDDLYNLYVLKQLTINDIAKKYNCSVSVIGRLLKLNNISIEMLKESS